MDTYAREIHTEARLEIGASRSVERLAGAETFGERGWATRRRKERGRGGSPEFAEVERIVSDPVRLPLSGLDIGRGTSPMILGGGRLYGCRGKAATRHNDASPSRHLLTHDEV